MGFGTLFIGYFLLLNIGYYSITDVVSAAIMLLGLYNLSRINKYFKVATLISIAFAIFGACEMWFGIGSMFFGVAVCPTLLSVFSAIRFFTVAVLTAAILLGIREVSLEVELEEMPTKCLSRLILSSLVFGFGFLLELPISHFVGANAHNYMSAITVLCELLIIVMNLTVIYGAYMKICMPEDNLPEYEKQIKKSRFAFVNQYRERKAEKAREEALYRLKKLEERSKKKKKGGKKRK